MTPRISPLQPLAVAIYRDGVIVAVSDLPDPRAAFCAQWNAMATDSEARPITEAEAEDARKTLAGQ